LFQKNPGKSKPLWLAPIATLTHGPFRRLVDGFGGCDGYYTEMVSAEALVNHGKYEYSYLDPTPFAKPVIIQLIGYSQEALVQATSMVRDMPFVSVDLNLGCSAPHILRKGGGSGWLRRKSDLLKLLEKMKRVLTNKPLTIKTRIPEDLQSPEALNDWLQDFPEAGVDMIAVHPRKPRENLPGSAAGTGLSTALQPLLSLSLGAGTLAALST
jgi:tRNA-dihydrouridine synthase B